MKKIILILLILSTLCMFIVSCNNVDTDINTDKNTDSSIKTDTETGEIIDTSSDISSDSDEIIDTGSDKTTDTNETTDTDSDETSDTNNDTSSDTTIDTESDTTIDTTTDTESDTTTDTESDTTTDTESDTDQTTDTDTDDDNTVKAPNFHMLDYNGNEVTLDSFKGKAVVLNFFASWCPPCKAEMPDFEAAYKTYGNDIEFVMVSHLAWGTDTIEKVKTFYSNSGYTFPVYFDYKYEGYNLYGLDSIPRTVIIDADGNVYKYYTGMINYETLVSDIESVTK